MKDHTKSRRGCQQCKTRKVKCDETLPCCRRCHRRRENCSYLQEYGGQGEPSPTADSDGALQPGSSATRAGSSSRGSPAPSSSAAADATTYPIDLELTHFYLVHTYRTSWGTEAGQLVWRDVIFPNSINHPALRNGIFAMAAMHRLMTASDMPPDRRAAYRTTALQKQTAALEGFVRLLQGRDEGTGEVALPMSMLVAQWAFASKILPPELNILSITMDVSPSFEAVPSFAMDSALTQFLELLRRVQPIHHVLEESRASLMAGPLSPLMAAPDLSELPPLAPETQKALGALRSELESVPDILQPFGLSSPIDSLYYMFMLSLRPEWGELMVGWIVRVPEQFIQALRDRRHPALVVLSYWAASFYPVNERWWARGWSMALIREVSYFVEEPWRGLMAWPRKYIGLEE